MQRTNTVEIFPSRIRPHNNNLFHRFPINDYPVLKYSSLWMNIAIVTSQESSAERRKVGCVIVTEDMGLYTGYNGTLAGDTNKCEVEDQTKPDVIHAESNALNKMAHEGVSVKNSIVFITLSPCIECAKRLIGSGVKVVVYLEEYRDLEGVDFLKNKGIYCIPFETIHFKKGKT